MPRNERRETLLQIPIASPNNLKRALRTNEAHFFALAELASIIVWVTDEESYCNYISKCWKEYTGRNPETDLGFRWTKAIHPEDRSRVANKLIEATHQKQPFIEEFRLRRTDGAYGWFHDHGVPLFHLDGSYAGHVGTRVDLSSYKKKAKDNPQIQFSLLLGQEAERKRIARELHDDIGQRLALLGVTLDEIKQLLPNASVSTPLRTKLKEVRESVDTLASDTHRISHNLHPSMLAHLGLVPALRRLCKEFSSQAHISVEFISKDLSVQIPQEVAIAVFRIAQECLANVAKHSNARVARVQLSQNRGSLHLVIADSGKGFDVKQAHSKGLGLISTCERTRMIGGRIEIDSAISRGTTVDLRVPIAGRVTIAGRTLRSA
ncbi:MAG TPA: PAS domain-containing protein [Terriglobales bacterium]|jgi:PAS domain S-box-containing protein